MLLRKYTFVRLFATSLALASQGGSVAPNQTQWQSGDCIDKKIDERTIPLHQLVQLERVQIFSGEQGLVCLCK